MNRGFVQGYFAARVAQPTELAKRINAPWPLTEGVVNFGYRVGDDWSGDAAIYFSIVLSDLAAHPTVLAQTTKRSRITLWNISTPCVNGISCRISISVVNLNTRNWEMRFSAKGMAYHDDLIEHAIFGHN